MMRTGRKESLILVLLFALISFLLLDAAAAHAEDVSASGDSTNIPIRLTTQPACFSVRLPTALPYWIQSDGTVLLPDSLPISNRGRGQVRVADLMVEQTDGENGTDDEGNGRPKLSFELQGVRIGPDGHAEEGVPGTVDGNSDLRLTCTARSDGGSSGNGTAGAAALTVILDWRTQENTTMKEGTAP